MRLKKSFSAMMAMILAVSMLSVPSFAATGTGLTGAATELTGFVTISGNPKFGETLTAINTGTNALSLEYQWKRVNGSSNEDILSATSKTYVLKAEDIGKKLIVTIKDASGEKTGTIDSQPTEEVKKADGPVAPLGLSGVAPTAVGIPNGKITGTTTAMEYKLNSASDFTQATEPEITGLAAGTYKVRVKDTATHKPGEEAEVVVPAFTPVATITLSQTSEHIFESQSVGYSQFEYKFITITNNSSTNQTGPLYIKATGANSDKFDISDSGLSSIDASGKEVFGVRPYDGLAEGTYTATIKVGSDTVPYQQFDVKFVVTAAPAALTGTVALSGIPKFGQTITAVLSESNALTEGVTSYVWKRQDIGGGGVAAKVIPSATSATYTLTQDDIAKEVFVEVKNSVLTGMLTSAPIQVTKADAIAIGVAPVPEYTAPSSGGGGGVFSTVVRLSGTPSTQPQKQPEGQVPPATKLEKERSFKLMINSNSAEVVKDGKTSTIMMDATPFIAKGRTMVPLRYLGELLGLKVEWLSQSKTVKLTDSKTEILVPLTSLTMKVNGKDVQSDVLPVLREARTYLSISNIAKALGLEGGKNIKWNNETKEVIVEKQFKKN